MRPPQISQRILAVAGVLALLLIALLASVLFPSIRPMAARQSSQGHATPAANSMQAVAIAGVKAKTRLRYADRCSTSGPCLTIVGEALGQDAAAVVFSTAGPAGRQCVGYVYDTGGSWHFLEAVCGLPSQLSPLIGHDATVHVPGSCANLRDQPSLNGAVLNCLYNGTTVHIDGGPNYADGRLWWHETHGWMAHNFLTAP